jgi:enoyl-CoA hydratase/carnithine racemase
MVCSLNPESIGLITEFDANARLIAAAPELLEALEHISKELCDGEYVKHSPDAISKVKHAIAKARGES